MGDFFVLLCKWRETCSEDFGQHIYESTFYDPYYKSMWKHEITRIIGESNKSTQSKLN